MDLQVFSLKYIMSFLGYWMWWFLILPSYNNYFQRLTCQQTVLSHLWLWQPVEVMWSLLTCSSKEVHSWKKSMMKGKYIINDWCFIENDITGINVEAYSNILKLESFTKTWVWVSHCTCFLGTHLSWKPPGKDIWIWLLCFLNMVKESLFHCDKCIAFMWFYNISGSLFCSRSWYSCTNRGDSGDSFELGLLWRFSRCSCISSSSRYNTFR